MKRRVILSAGHTNVPGLDQGRQTEDRSEGVVAAILRSDLYYTLLADKVEVLTDEDNTTLKDSIKYFKDMVIPTDIAIDIHFNGFDDERAFGTEVLVPKDASNVENKLAAALSSTISATLGTRNRGVKSEAESHHGSLGWMRLNCETVLIEVCFITNKRDMESFDNNYWTLVNKIADVIKSFV